MGNSIRKTKTARNIFSFLRLVSTFINKIEKTFGRLTAFEKIEEPIFNSRPHARKHCALVLNQSYKSETLLLTGTSE